MAEVARGDNCGEDFFGNAKTGMARENRTARRAKHRAHMAVSRLLWCPITVAQKPVPETWGDPGVLLGSRNPTKKWS